MKILNAKHSSETPSIIVTHDDGSVLCVPIDAANRHYAELLASGVTIEPAETPLVTEKDYSTAIQAHIDETAQLRPGGGYADGVTASSYVSSTVPVWAADANAFVAWRDSVWIYAFTELAKAQAGQRSAPTVGDFIKELPAIKWPA